MVESIVTKQGHDVVGVADATSAATGLVEHARPDAVIVDMSLGYNTDFDVIETAESVGAKVIVFSFHADESLLNRYAVRPRFVPKPDFVELEQTVERLARDAGGIAAESDRRHHPVRAANGPAPTGPEDAHAFYEALNNAVDGDTLVAIDLVADGSGPTTGGALTSAVARVIRETDRLLATASAVKVLLAGGGADGSESFMRRLDEVVHLPPGTHVRSVVLVPGESPAEAFDRLKQHGDAHHR
jgi:CheY-like chemotaxis protein